MVDEREEEEEEEEEKEEGEDDGGILVTGNALDLVSWRVGLLI